MQPRNPAPTRPSGLRRSPLQIVLGGLFLAFGLFYLYSATGIRVPPIGDLLGPRFFPFALGSLFVAFCLANLLRDVVDPSNDPIEAKPRDVNLRTGLIFAASIAYAVAMLYIGYIITTAIFLFAFLTIVRFRGPFFNAGLAAATTAAFYLVFNVWLGVNLPPLPAWL